MSESKKATIEERNAKSLESIANSLDALSLWFEEIDKEEWGPRIDMVPFYVEFMKSISEGKR